MQHNDEARKGGGLLWMLCCIMTHLFMLLSGGIKKRQTHYIQDPKEVNTEMMGWKRLQLLHEDEEDDDNGGGDLNKDDNDNKNDNHNDNDDNHNYNYNDNNNNNVKRLHLPGEDEENSMTNNSTVDDYGNSGDLNKDDSDNNDNNNNHYQNGKRLHLLDDDEEDSMTNNDSTVVEDHNDDSNNDNKNNNNDDNVDNDDDVSSTDNSNTKRKSCPRICIKVPTNISVEEKQKDRGIMRNALLVGLGKEDTRHPHSYKGLVMGKEVKKTDIVSKKLKDWQPSEYFKIFAYSYSTIEKPLLFENGLQLLSVLSAESRKKPAELLATLGITLITPNRRSKKHQVILLRYTHLFSATEFPDQISAHTDRFLIANMKLTVQRLMNCVIDCHNSDLKAGLVVAHRRTVKWASVDKLSIHFENLLQVVHLTLMVIELIFNFVKENKDNNGMSYLISHTQLMMQKIEHYTKLWEWLEKLLRVFSSFTPKEKQDDIRKEILNNPSQFRTYIRTAEITVPAELYRDRLKKELAIFDETIELVFQGPLEQKDSLILRWFILNKRFKAPDNGLLFLRCPTQPQLIIQNERHAVVANKYNIILEENQEIDKPKAKEGNDNNKSNSNSTSLDDPVSTLPLNGLCLISDGAFGDDNGSITHQDNDLDFEDIDDSLSIDLSDDDGSLPTSEIEKGVNTDGNKAKRLCQGLSRSKSHSYEVVSKLSEKRTQEIDLLLMIQEGQHFNHYIAFSMMQVMWLTQLGESQHHVTRKREEKANMIFGGSVGVSWYPATVSRLTRDCGIVRSNHPLFKKSLQDLNRVDINMLCKFVMDVGEADQSRDDTEAESFRFNFGLSNHDYEHRTEKKEPFKYFRDLPKINNIGKIEEYNPNLKVHLRILMEGIQNVVDEGHVAIGEPRPLDDSYINATFAEVFAKEMGGEKCRFQSATLGLNLLDWFTEGDVFGSNEGSTKKQCGTSHDDNLNGKRKGNEYSGIFSIFIILKDKISGRRRAARLYMILYTRISAEIHEDNEALFSDMKEKLLHWIDEVNHSYQRIILDRSNPRLLSFNHPEHLVLKKDWDFWDNVDIGIGSKKGIQKVLSLQASYSGVLQESSIITALRRIYLHTKSEEKALDALLLASYQCTGGLFYDAVQNMINNQDTVWEENLAVQLATIMENDYGSWCGARKGFSQRGRPSSIKFITYYSNNDNYKEAKEAIRELLIFLNDNGDVDLKRYQEKVGKMSTKLNGIGHFYGQRIVVKAACAGIILKRNIKYATYGYPVENGGASYETIKQIDDRLQQQMNDGGKYDDEDVPALLKAMRFKPTLESDGFPKAARVACQFCKLQEHRTLWGEYIYCEGLGRVTPVIDHFYYGQSLFWIFRENDCITYTLKEKKFNNDNWVPLQSIPIYNSTKQ